MERRDLLRIAAWLGAGSVASTVVSKHGTAEASVRYESHGGGPAIVLGSPISASNDRQGATLSLRFVKAMSIGLSIVDWRDEDAVSKFTSPRMTVVRRDDSITTAGHTVRIGPLVAERRPDLERMGWTVHVVDGFQHELFTRPDVVVTLMRAFLDPVLLRA